MKRHQLVEYGLIIAGIFFGYRAVDNCFYLIYQLMFQMGEYGVPTRVLLRSLFFIALYCSSAFLLIRNSQPLSAWLMKDRPEEKTGIMLHWQQVLGVVLIALAFAVLIDNLPDTIGYLFQSFRQEASGRIEDDFTLSITKDQFRQAAIRTVVAILMLVFYRNISHWFIRKHEADALIFESEEEKP